jgi:GAF domain-containing protein
MMTAPWRNNELKALQALQTLSVLDSAPEPEFDALAHAAANICLTSGGLVSLVDVDRQWFKASVGFEGPSQTSRELSFCAHAVLDDKLLVVEDAAQDPRFSDHPFVVGAPYIRFYAGAPLILPDDVRIGTLCVIDQHPRRLDPAQRFALQRLASAVVTALQGRAAVQRLKLLTAGDQSWEVKELLQSALSNVDGAMQHVFSSTEVTAELSLVNAAPTASVKSPEPAGRASDNEVRKVAAPKVNAMHFCLTSIVALLGITLRLLQPEKKVLTPIEQTRLRAQLAEDTKIAGGAAYRAALALAEPHAGHR